MVESALKLFILSVAITGPDPVHLSADHIHKAFYFYAIL